MEKVCSKCGAVKASSEFGTNPRMRSGLSSYCKACVREHSREWAKRNKSKLTWRNLRNRCQNPKDISYVNYVNYGGRGIQVCQEWQDFATFDVWFQSTYEPGLVLDRINNDGGYSPDNCRWATLSVQNSNKRVTEKQLAHIRRAAAKSLEVRKARRKAAQC